MRSGVNNKIKIVFLILMLISFSNFSCAQSEEAKSEQSRQHQRKSNELRLQKDLDGALIEQLKAVEITPNDLQTQQVLGSLYIQTAQEKNKPEYLPKAKEALEKAVKINPNDVITHSMLADVLAQTGDKQGAVKEQLETVKLAPNNVRYISNLGTYYGLIKDKKSEREQYERALRIDGNHSPTVYNLALLEKEEGNYNRAIELFKRTIKLDEEDEQSINRADNLSVADYRGSFCRSRLHK